MTAARERFQWTMKVPTEVHSDQKEWTREEFQRRVDRFTSRYGQMGFAVYDLTYEIEPGEDGIMVYRVQGWRHLDGRPTEVDRQVRADCHINPHLTLRPPIDWGP